MRRGLPQTITAVVLAAGLTSSACNALLSIEDQPLRPDSRGASDSTSTETPDTFPSDGDVAAGYAQAVLADAPVLYLRFAERDEAFAHDEMRRFDGTYPASGLTLGVPGVLPGNSAILLDGTTRIIMPAGADFAGLSQFSVELWLKQDPASPRDAFVIDHETHAPKAPTRYGWDLVSGNEGVKFGRYKSETSYRYANGPILPSFEWHHVLATFDGKNQNLFIDGRIADSAAAGDISVTPAGGAWSIGGLNCDCTLTFFHGGIDELAIYDHVLPSDRVRIHLQAAGR